MGHKGKGTGEKTCNRCKQLVHIYRDFPLTMDEEKMNKDMETVQRVLANMGMTGQEEGGPSSFPGGFLPALPASGEHIKIPLNVLGPTAPKHGPLR